MIFCVKKRKTLKKLLTLKRYNVIMTLRNNANIIKEVQNYVPLKRQENTYRRLVVC